MTARRVAKAAAERALLWSGAARAALRLRRGHTLILAYHNIVPRDATPAGDQSLHLPLDRFAEQLDALVDTLEIVPLDAALARLGQVGGRPRAAITFDDAYRGAVTAGIAELVRRGLPATIFVPPGLLDDREFWWDALTPTDEPSLQRELRERALRQLGGKQARVLNEAQDVQRTSPLPAHARSATDEELRAAARRPGITLASHSWSHPNLAALDFAELEVELTRPIGWLRERFESTLPYLAYPYGLSSPTVERAARDAGYRAAFRIDGGWVRGVPDTVFNLPRIDIPSGVSVDGFRLRTAGVLGR